VEKGDPIEELEGVFRSCSSFTIVARTAILAHFLWHGFRFLETVGCCMASDGVYKHPYASGPGTLAVVLINR
jgi:hypothetical protein